MLDWLLFFVIIACSLMQVVGAIMALSAFIVFIAKQCQLSLTDYFNQ